MFLHRNDQKMTTFNYFGPRILFVRPERTVGNNGLKVILMAKNYILAKQTILYLKENLMKI